MPKQDDRSKRVGVVVAMLKKEYPGAKTALTHHDPFQLLVATILSAQCTDERVNKVTPGLFTKYRTVKAFATVAQAELEGDIRSTGFFRNKARNIIGCSTALMAHHHGSVPETMEELVKLPGVGRKTANVVLSEAFGKSEGIVVDTHVHRLSQRLGFTEHDDPVRIEQDLMAVVPRRDWGAIGLLLILHGRSVCKARTPACGDCLLSPYCLSSTV
jgi:endonuclease-3